MKHLKKLIPLMLALVMVLTLAPAAFAAGTGSITIDNAKENATYTAYKIFDVVYNTDKSAYSYTIDSDSLWYDTVDNYDGVTLEQVNGTTTWNVTKNDKFSAAVFAEVLAKALKDELVPDTGTALRVSNGQATVTGLDLGYYFVTTTTGALCNLTTTNSTVTIHDKNDVPFEKKDDKESVDVGEIVTYTITGKVPDTTGFTAYTYEINDTMSDGLTFNKDVKVYVDGTEITGNFSVDYNVSNGFKLTIDVMNLQNNVTDEIKVTYTATVNANAAGNVENNKATLTYSNDPTDDEKKITTPEDMETVYSAKIVIDKYANGDTSKKLAGAKFVLKNDQSKYYKIDNNVVSWVDTIDNATEVTTNGDGAASFIGLKDGTYYLHETEAPVGYNKLASDVEVVIDGANATTADLSSLTVTRGVENKFGAVLPETGGLGTTLLTTFGSLLVVGAGILLATKRRASMME